MAFRRLSNSSYSFFILLNLCLFFVSTSAIRLSQFDELDTENSISNQRSLQRRGTEEQGPSTTTITGPITADRKKVIRLGIKHEEHFPNRFPLVYDEESGDMQPSHEEHTQEEEEEIHLEARAANYVADYEASDTSFKHTCIGCEHDKSYHMQLEEPRMPYHQEPLSDEKRASPDVPEESTGHPCSCFASDEVSGVCFCNMKDNGIHKCPTILHQEHGIDKYEERLHRREMMGQDSNSPENRKGSGFLYSRNALPLPKKKGKGKRKGNSKISKSVKCKGKNCRNQEKEAQSKGKKGKSRHAKRDAYMYRGQHRGVEMEL